MMSIFGRGSQVAPIYTLLVFATPTLPVCVSFCVVATWLPLLPLHKEISTLWLYIAQLYCDQ